MQIFFEGVKGCALHSVFIVDSLLFKALPQLENSADELRLFNSSPLPPTLLSFITANARWIFSGCRRELLRKRHRPLLTM